MEALEEEVKPVDVETDHERHERLRREREVEGTVYCVICTEKVPEDRLLRKAVTCSDEHSKTLKNLRRRKRDMKHCRMCNRPANPEERAMFARWRRETMGETRGRPKKQLETENPESQEPED
jgi:predicted nucleic acid-binding Zn ribbon protein